MLPAPPTPSVPPSSPRRRTPSSDPAARVAARHVPGGRRRLALLACCGAVAVAGALGGAVLGPRAAAAQTTDAAIVGTVRDTAGRPLAGVAVTARDAATGFRTATTTNADGQFSLLQLPLGGPYAVAFRRGSDLSAREDYQGRGRDLRQFTTTQWGGSAGGPIVRDRLHYFAAFDRQDRSAPLVSGVLNTSGDQVAAGVARDSVTRLLQILRSTYGLDSTRTQFGRLARRPGATTGFGRLDWEASAHHHLTLRSDLSAWSNPLSGGVDQALTPTVGTDNTLTRTATFIGESQGGLFEFQSLADLAARRAFRYSRTVPLGGTLGGGGRCCGTRAATGATWYASARGASRPSFRTTWGTTNCRTPGSRSPT